MRIGSYCRGPACMAEPDETLQAAAQRMEKDGVGLLVVTEGEEAVGVVTDRDIVLHAVAGERDAALARVADAMTRPVVAIDVASSLEDAFERMGSARVRRLPVTDGRRVTGVVSADDLGLLLAREIGGLGEVLVAQLPAGASRSVGREAPSGLPHRPAQRYARDVVTAAHGASVAEVARTMDAQAVGSVVVLDGDGKGIGLVTDRDLALRVVAAGRHPARTPVSAVSSTPLVGARPADPLEEVVAQMRTKGVRRVPILEAGRPVGMVAYDDLLVAFAHELGGLADGVEAQIRHSRRRSVPARMRHELEDRIEDIAARLWDVGGHTLRTVGREIDQVFDRVTKTIRDGSHDEGSRLSVAELMTRDVRTCTPEDTLAEAARIMWERDCGCVPVVAGDGSGRVVGMVTDRDLCMAIYTRGGRLPEMRVGSVMARRVYSCRPEDAIAEAETVMRTAQVRRLPVVDADGHLRGLLSLADIAEGAAGSRAPAGAVSAAEAGLVLEAICRPRTALERR